jgi:outer membrane protein assembly factor BamB
MAVAFPRPRGIEDAVLVNQRDSEPEVRAFDASGHEVWRTRVATLSDSWATFGLPAGPAFVTVDRVSPTEDLSVATTTARITVLDGATGRLRWQQDFVVDGPTLSVGRLAGDVLVNVPTTGLLTRLRGTDGQAVWTQHYVDQERYDGSIVPDETGDGVSDFLHLDTAAGPVLYSGADGSVNARPLYAPAGLEVFPVSDLNGDGAADVIGFPNVDQGVNPVATQAALAVAFNGKTGLPLWHAFVGPVSMFLDVTSAPLDERPGADVVIQDVTGTEYALDGQTGSSIWTHQD